MLISTSILNIKDDECKINKIDKSNTDYIHLDIMDGLFVKNKVDFNKLNFNKKIDIHLMTYDVINYVNRYKHLNPEYITFHLEINENIKEIINYIKSLSIKVGISIKPSTDVKKLLPYLNEIDLVLVMSVEPGKGGQLFIENTTDKIKELIKLKEYYSFVIEVDGGINDETIKKISKADMAVVGSFITNHEDFNKQIDKLK